MSDTHSIRPDRTAAQDNKVRASALARVPAKASERAGRRRGENLTGAGAAASDLQPLIDDNESGLRAHDGEQRGSGAE